MNISRVISFLKENYMHNADEIYECLSLLTDTLDTTLESIQHSTNGAFIRRDFAKIKSYTDMADEINNIYGKIKEYMEELRVNAPEEVDNDGEESEDSKEQPQEELVSVDEEEFDKNLDNDDYRVDSNIKHTLNEDFSFKKPAAFGIDSTRIDVKDWRDLFFLTCETLARKDRSIFESFISDPSMNGRRIKYFSKVRRGMVQAKKLPGTDIYITMQLGANSSKRLISKMLRKYNMDVDKYYIYLSEDYTGLLKK